MARDEVNPVMVVREDEFDPERHIQTGGGTRIKGRLAGGVRDKVTMARMKAQIANYWADEANYTYAEIAEKISDEFGLEGDMRLKANSISFHIKSLIKYWKDAALWSVDEKMARVQARYAQLEAIAESALYASMEGKETRSYKKQMSRAKSKNREKWIADEIKYQREQAEKRGEKLKVGDVDEGFEDNLLNTAENIENIEELLRTESSPGDPRWLTHLITINDRRADLWNLKQHAEVQNADQEMARLPDDERDKRLVAVINSALGRRDKIQHSLAPPSPLGGRPQEEAVAFDESDIEDLEF